MDLETALNVRRGYNGYKTPANVRKQQVQAGLTNWSPMDTTQIGRDDGLELQKTLARQQGWDESQIEESAKYQQFLKALEQRAGISANGAQPEKEKSKDSFWSNLIPAGASTAGAIAGAKLGAMGGAGIGSAFGGVGAAPGAVIGTLLGGIGGALGGVALENVVEDKPVFSDPRHYAIEGALGAIPGVFKGAKVLKNAPAGFKTAKMLTQIPTGKAVNATRAVKSGMIDDVVRASTQAGKKGVSYGSQYLDDAVKASTKGSKALKFGQVYPGNKLEQVGWGMRERGFFPKLDPSSPFGAQKMAEITQTMGKFGLHGSPKQMYRQLPAVAESLGKQADDVIRLSKTKVPITALKSQLNKVANTAIDIGGYSKANAAKQVDALMGTIKNGTMQEIRSAHKMLNGNLSNAFTKLQKGVPLSQKETIDLALRNSLDDILKQNVPEAKALLRNYSTLFDASKGLATQGSKTFSIPMFGVTSNTAKQSIYGAKDMLGRGLVNTGQALNFRNGNPAALVKALSAPQGAREIAKAAGTYGAGQLAARGLTGKLTGDMSQNAQAGNLDQMVLQQQQLDQLFNEYGIDPEKFYRTIGIDPATMSQMPQDPMADQVGGFEPTPQSPYGTATQPSIAGQTPQNQMVIPREAIVQAMMQDLASTGGKNIDKLQKFFEFANYDALQAASSGGAGELNADQKKNLLKVANVDTQLAQLQAFVDSGFFPDQPQWQASLGGIWSRNIGRQIDPEMRTYIAQLKGRGIQVIRALGEVGNLSQSEQEAAINNLPAVGDNLETAQMKIQALRNLFSEVRNNIVTYGGYDNSYSGNVIDPNAIGGFATTTGGY